MSKLHSVAVTIGDGRRVALLACAIVLGMPLSACSSDQNSSANAGGTSGSATSTGGKAATAGSSSSKAGDGPATTAGGGGEAGDDSAGGAPGDECNALENVAAIVADTHSDEAPPEPKGGTITSGTYYVTAFTVYQAIASCNRDISRRGTAVVQADTTHAGTMQTVDATGFTGAPLTESWHYTFTYETSGTDLGFRLVCGMPYDQPLGSYSATPDRLDLFFPGGEDDSCGTVVWTYEKP